MATSKPRPVSDAQLQTIAKEACDSTLATATGYIHTQTESWNTAIINRILESLIATASKSQSAQTSAQTPQYKYAVNSTIIQHLADTAIASSSSANASTSTQTPGDGQTVSPPTTPGEGQGAAATGATGASATATSGGSGMASDPEKGRRGMHSATGAFWNNETDGMWSYKWEGGNQKGMDVVISVIWVSVS